MKNTKTAQIFVLMAAGVLGCSTAAKAQHYGDNWDGGSGTWNLTNTNWDNGNVYYNSNNRTDIAVPVFTGAGGTVQVDESGGNLYNGIMVFYSGNWTFDGDPLYSISTDFQAQVVVMNPGTGNVTINNTIDVAPNPTNNGSVFANESAGTTLTLGNINISSVPQSGTDGNGNPYYNQSAPFQFNHGGTNVNTINDQNLLFLGSNGTTTILNGSITTDPNLYVGMLFGYYGQNSTAVYEINGPLLGTNGSNKDWDFGSGKILLGTSQLGTGALTFEGQGNSSTSAAVMPLLTNVAGLNITNQIYAQGGNANTQIGSAVAGATEFSGSISSGSGNGSLDLYATHGATVTFSNNINGDNGFTTKSGNGTVILSNSGGNSWTTYNSDAFEMKAGTTIITNTSGDAFGNGAQNGTVGPVFVQLDAGAKLAGTGSTTKMLNALGATSEISPGLSNTIGLMSLGGLTATNGLTMDFKLNGGGTQYGVNNDFIQLGTLTLGGTVTINLTALDNPLIGEVYRLFGAGSPVTGTPTFDVIAPTGYELDSSYGNGVGGGYNYNRANGLFSVELIPEPSTYGLLGLGLLALVAIGHWMRRGQTV